MIELDEICVMPGGGFRAGIVLGHMLDQKLAARLKKRKHLVGQRIHRFVRDKAVRIIAPAIGSGDTQNENSNRKRKRALSLATH
jgi:hypothetical protein